MREAAFDRTAQGGCRNGSENAARSAKMIAVERVKRGASSNRGETSGSKALETRFANQACFFREQTSSNDVCYP